jgi:hypothetical protein
MDPTRLRSALASSELFASKFREVEGKTLTDVDRPKRR